MKVSHWWSVPAFASILLGVLTANGYAGYNAEYRKNCNVFAKYRLRAILKYSKGGTSSRYACPGGCVDKGCGFAAINETWVDNQVNPPVTHASIQKRIGSSPYSTVYTENSYYSAGAAFRWTEVVQPDSIGIARNTMDAAVLVADGVGTTVITLNGFSGALSAKTGSQFGSVLRCVVWKATSPADSLVRPQTILADGSVRIEKGVVVATGMFSASDFTTSTAIDSTGFQVVTVQAVPGLSKTITVPVVDGDNSVALSMFGDVGYGTYDPNGIFEEPPSSGFQTVPAESPWSLAILAVLLGVAAAYQMSRQAQHS